MMKTSAAVLAVAAFLTASPGLAQAPAGGTDHQSHHPGAAQAQGSPSTTSQPASPSTSAQPSMQGRGMMGGMGQGMQGQGMMGGMGQGMMSCPMMQRGMAGMMGQGGMGGMQMGQPRGDQSVGSLALGAINQRMHREMTMDYTGDVDADFARSMIAHHQGAIDMAKVVAAFGKDPKIRELAQAIIKAQEDEIETMRTWLAQKPR